MFEIEMLPAREGDCLWVRYGEPGRPRQFLVDGGRAATGKELRARFAKLPPGEREFELLIVTHVDRDHIEGVLEFITDSAPAVTFKDIWFNGYDHLLGVKLETFGALQGEKLSKALSGGQLPWNRKWKSGAVCLPKSGLKSVKLDGGMTLTLFSPDRPKLKTLAPVWEKECAAAGLLPGQRAKPSERKDLEAFGPINIEQLASNPFDADPGEANGSSIAVLAEYDGKRALLTGDAHADRLVASIKLFKKEAPRLKLDAFKVAHHASTHNVSEELVKLLDCPRYLISTNGSYFKHPTPEAVARILMFSGKKKKKLFFNYRTQFTEVWDEPAWKAKHGYEVVFPDGQNGTLKVSL